MKSRKSGCPLSFKFITYSGWTDVYLRTGGDNIFFILSNTMGSSVDDLVDRLYFLSPKQDDRIVAGNPDYLKVVVDEKTEEILGTYEGGSLPENCTCEELPMGVDFVWDEEGSHSSWTLTRDIDGGLGFDFAVKLHIEIHRDEVSVFDYEFTYKELCYAVAKAYTEMIKEYGFFGYHQCADCMDMDINKFLYIKAVALDCIDFRKTSVHSSGDGVVPNYSKELELLKMDM